MDKRIKSFIFVICTVMVFTAQTKRPDDKGQQHAPSSRPAPASRPAPVVHNNQTRPQVQTRRAAPQQAAQRSLPRANIRIPQPLDLRREQGPHVYAVPASAPAQNNRLLNRQHHNHWQPRYNFYDDQYHFYPYVNIASMVELTPDCVPAGFNGQTYYYDQGTFYIQDDQGQYVAVAPPIGIFVTAIPGQAREIDVNGQVFYRYKGVFYVQVSGGYQVVGPVQPDPGN